VTEPARHLRVTTVDAMEALGRSMAPGCAAVRRIYFHGELGSGKTALIRGLLHGLGYVGAVHSPTFTLVEPYTVNGRAIFHFDLYRLNDAEELEFIGAREYLEGEGLCLVEWAERGKGFLPVPDVDVMIRHVEEGREVQFESRSKAGAELIRGLAGNRGAAGQ
jgi:tRNA threonylcarbamoyladenosine biosynthesis protein TsaE